MQYERDFPRCFMARTKKNLEQYQGDFEATHLVNSLLGLLIVPKEAQFTNIPDTPVDQLCGDDWGNITDWLGRPTRCDLGHEHTLTLRQFVRRLRNAVAHFEVQPFPESGVVKGFKFADRRSSFEASIPIADLKRFVLKLCSSLSDQPE